jgi:hypothetical protein
MTLPQEVMKLYLEIVGMTEHEFIEYHDLSKKQTLTETEAMRLSTLAAKLSNEAKP